MEESETLCQEEEAKEARIEIGAMVALADVTNKSNLQSLMNSATK